jgi:hypothetical protein
MARGWVGVVVVRGGGGGGGGGIFEFLCPTLDAYCA